MDASGATYNAVQKCFPNSKILMCYFHVVFNCKKMYKDKGLSSSDWNIVHDDIANLHSCMTSGRIYDLLLYF